MGLVGCLNFIYYNTYLQRITQSHDWKCLKLDEQIKGIQLYVITYISL